MQRFAATFSLLLVAVLIAGFGRLGLGTVVLVLCAIAAVSVLTLAVARFGPPRLSYFLPQAPPRKVADPDGSTEATMPDAEAVSTAGPADDGDGPADDNVRYIRRAAGGERR